MGADVVAISLHHFARLGAEVAHREDVKEVVVGLGEVDAQRVAVDHLDTGNLRVVVELPGLLRAVGDVLDAGHAVLDQPEVGRAQLRIDQAFHRKFIVARDELPLASLERGVVGEVDSLAQLERVRAAVVRDLGQRLEGLGLQLGRAREEIVGERRLDDLLDDVVRVEVRDRGRVEIGLRDEIGHPEHLGRRVRHRELGEREKKDGG